MWEVQLRRAGRRCERPNLLRCCSLAGWNTALLLAAPPCRAPTQHPSLARPHTQPPPRLPSHPAGKALPPTPSNEIGYVALFGYRGAQARRMDITKNEGGWVSECGGGLGWRSGAGCGCARVLPEDAWCTYFGAGGSAWQRQWQWCLMVCDPPSGAVLPHHVHTTAASPSPQYHRAGVTGVTGAPHRGAGVVWGS